MRGKILSIGVLIVLILSFLPIPAGSVCGDVNNDGQSNVLDIICLIYSEFKGGPAPYSWTNADYNGDGYINILDITRMIEARFKCGPNEKCGHIPPLCPLFANIEINSGCLSGKDEGEDYMTVEVVGNDLHIYHWDAFYQCCLEYEVDYLLPAGKIIAYEYDRGDFCDCYCPFNLESILNDVASGTYEVILIGIGGDTVGVETVVVPQ